MRKVCVVTGTRAEYGLLSRLMRFIADDSELQLQIIATNMHLSPEFGLTYKEIEADGFVIDKKVQMLLSADTANATVKSMGLATIGFADAIEDLKPDLLLVLGDRFEILSAVTSALIYKIPVAHLHGGEITEGAYDDAIRHAITKMSHLHFTSTEEYKQRVIQMGENPKMVHCVGAIGVDNIRHTPLMNKEELEISLNFKLDEDAALVTFHPVTLENNATEEQFALLLEALDQFQSLHVIFTMPNSDTGGHGIMNMIKYYVNKNAERMVYFESLGAKRYLSVLQYVKVVVGNSSSGIVEVPSFHIPTINIGNRQKGRVAPPSVLHCTPTKDDIVRQLKVALDPDFRKTLQNIKNPYEVKDTAGKILAIVKEQQFDNTVKQFYNVSF